MKALVLKIAALAIVALAGTSCMTTYDAYGRPMQTVDPGAAALGIAAAGIAGYAIGHNNHHYHGGYYGPYYGPYHCY